MATKHLLMGDFHNSSGDHAGGYDDQMSRAGLSSCPPLRQNYEVFLSFRGVDTRHTFTDHLYHGLVNRGIGAFRDKENLHVGEKIDRLLEAIMASKILVPIISPRYASSKWCLKELVQILKCSKLSPKLVLPILYKVKPSDVGDQKGEFGKGFQQFKETHSDTKLVQDSEQAFKEIVSLKVWESDKEFDGYEAPFLKAVVERIFNELRKPILDVPEFLVGVEEHVKEIIKMVDAKQSNDAKIIAIYGMGGIGKTTLAKVLYNDPFNRFDSRSFVPNIREASSTNEGMLRLQKHVISDILVDKSPQKISHVDEGISIIKNSFKGKRLLLVLDDVVDKDQLNKLAVKYNGFESESIIIITTRNKDIAVASGVYLSYELNELGKDQSYILFCKHAFGGDASCQSNLESIARKIVSMTGGLPLAIEVFGCLLHKRSEGFWRDTLKKLSKVPNKKVLDKLLLSYQDLEENQQQIFLDIACLPIQQNTRYAFYMWDACDFYPEEGIQILISKSLVKIRDGQIVMHDQLRDLGREIVRKESCGNIGLCSRLWLQEEAVREMIEEKKGTEKIQALAVQHAGSNKSDKIHFPSEQFKRMKNLRYLSMDGVYLTGDFENLLSKLVYFKWKGGDDFDIMGINFNPRKLVVLALDGTNITENWKGWNQVKDLKVLHLRNSHDITTSPDLSAVEGLEELVLYKCNGLEKIHPSIRKFRKTLKLFCLNCCSMEHKELPGEVWEMEELRELYLASWGRLEYIPNTIGSLVKLQKLILRGNKSLINIPEDIGKLKLLIWLDLSETGVTQLPDSIKHLYNLEVLLIAGTPIKCVPASIEMLSRLRVLALGKCEKLESLQNLPCSLIELRFIGKSMETPPDISNLTHLKRLIYGDVFKRRNRVLDLRKLNQLEHLHIYQFRLPEWPEGMERDEESKDINLSLELPLSLKTLEVGGCPWTSPNLSNLKNLSWLAIRECPELNYLELEGAESLTSLDIRTCKKLSSLSASKKLKHLLISDCSNLVEIQGLEHAESLKVLRIGKCCSLERISNLSHLRMLTTLELLDCVNLSNVQGIENLTSLTKLCISESSLDSLDLSAFKKLKKLEIGGCSDLVEIQGLEDVEALKTLRIKHCRSLKRIANLSHLMMLTALELCDCKNLSNVQDIERLTSLTKLRIFEQLLDSLNLSASRKLKHLLISDCSNLVEIQGLEHVESLEVLGITKCCSLERISNLSDLKMLTTLALLDCVNLSNVQGIENLTSLTKLHIPKPLQDSLDLSQLTNLQWPKEIPRSKSSLDELEESQSDFIQPKGKRRKQE